METPAEKLECDHYWASHVYDGLSIRLCQFCHEPDWDELRRTAALLAAYRKLYEVCWNECATVDIDLDGYNGISYEDCNAIEEAAEAVEALLIRERLGCPQDAPGSP